MKTIQDYLNDPRITGDLGLMRGPEEIRTIHAIRLKQQDETAGMSFEEKEALHRKRTDAMFDSLGLSLPQYVNFAGYHGIFDPETGVLKENRRKTKWNDPFTSARKHG